MLNLQTTQTNLEDTSRCAERGQMTDYEKDLSPTHKADRVIKESITHALWNDGVLRMMDYDEIDVQVINGNVYLNGHMVSTTSKSRIENTIRAIPDILTISNNLVLDHQLTSEVAALLGELEHTCGCKFFTSVSHGVVSLNGVVSDKNTRLLAEVYAASHPNVRGVINHVRVAGIEPGLYNPPFLQPRIEEIIYFLDGVSGVVKQVILNPNNRRVIAMVIQVRSIHLRDELNSPTDGKARRPEQLIVIPMRVVRYLTKSSGFLSIHSSERNRYKDFDLSAFKAPNQDWTPPYPYCPANVLFPIEYHEPDIRIAPETLASLAAAVPDDALAAQFYTNDSLGG